MNLSTFNLVFTVTVLLYFQTTRRIKASEIVRKVTKNPTPPVWSNEFIYNFNETFYNTHQIKSNGVQKDTRYHYTHGTFFYNYTRRCSRMDRVNGRYEVNCGSSAIGRGKDTLCTDLVVDGNRWLVYPQLQECCRLCSRKQGCGVLKPTWLGDATFLGDFDGVFKWRKDDILYVERAEDRVMLTIRNEFHSQDFHPYHILSHGKEMEEVCKLPSYCKKMDCKK